MVTIEFTSALKRFFPSLKKEEVEAGTVGAVIHKANDIYPGISQYVLTETGQVREHIKIYIDEEPAPADTALTTPLNSGQNVLIFQAISGG